jgi:enoyl-CoA hydratase
VTHDVLFRVQSGVGRVTLNRPKTLNALSHAMIRAIGAELALWAAEPSVRLVVLDGAGERGLCAGGDIRALYDDVKSGRLDGPKAFFYDEYRLNAQIAAYPKPIVALMDGIVMGGGIGLSAHASHRVVTPRSMLAMPEVAIGFVPDVGGTYLLGRAPGETGLHAALSAARLTAADALYCGLADICAATDRLADLAADLSGCADHDSASAVLATYHEQPPPGGLEAARGWIDPAYAGATVEDILAALEARPEADAKAAARDIAGKSPTSLKVTLLLIRRARALGRLAPCLQHEYHAALECLRGVDFVEGVRAALVDKDRAPRWQPRRLEDVSAATVERSFASSPEADLHLS